MPIYVDMVNIYAKLCQYGGIFMPIYVGIVNIYVNMVNIYQDRDSHQ